MDGKLSPVGAIQSGYVHLFDIHCLSISVVVFLKRICVCCGAEGAYTSELPDAQVLKLFVWLATRRGLH